MAMNVAAGWSSFVATGPLLSWLKMEHQEPRDQSICAVALHGSSPAMRRTVGRETLLRLR